MGVVATAMHRPSFRHCATQARAPGTARAAKYPVPDGVDDATAVLAEPLAVALHAVLAARPAAGSRVLIIGAGTVGLCVLAALRLLDAEAEVVAVARHPGQRELAKELGAAQIAGDIVAGRTPGRGTWLGRCPHGAARHSGLDRGFRSGI